MPYETHPELRPPESVRQKPFHQAQGHNTPLHFIISYSAEDSNAQEALDIATKVHDYYTSRSKGVDPPRTFDERVPYRESHHLWTPQFEKEGLRELLDSGHETHSDKKYASPLSNEAFINYVDSSSTIGQYPMPTLVHHTACEVKDTLYVLGGYEGLHHNYKTSAVDTSNFVVRRGVDLPLPLNSDLLNHPLMLPNDNLYVISAVTNRVTKPKITGEIPPPLLAMSASQITKRHIFYYGGFQIVDNVTNDGQVFTIDKEVILNNYGYLLDTTTLRFRKFELTAHPNMTTRFPITIPRFGHTSTSISSASSRPATIYIMGGYRRDANDPQKFEAIRDLWKLELSISYEGDNDYLEFSDIVLATPVSSVGPQPMARAFHAADIHRAFIVYHGGTNGTTIFGDVWTFDIHEAVWKELKTTFNGKPAQLKTVAHHAIVLDKFLAPIAGSTPCDLGAGSDIDQDEVYDLSRLYRSRDVSKTRGESSLFYMQFGLDLKSQTWLAQRVYHNYSVPILGKEDTLSYAGNVGSTVTLANSRTVLIGGQITADPDLNDMGKLHILNSALISFEFPLGCFVNDLKVMH